MFAKNFILFKRSSNMLAKILTVCLLISLRTCQSAKLPSYVKPCVRNDPNLSECILKQANDLIPKLKDGDKILRFPSVTPLKIPHLYIEFPGDLTIEITNASLYGFENTVLKSLNATITPEIDNSSVSFQMYIPKLKFEGEYDIAGKIFLLPINGQGPANVTFMPGLYNVSTFFKKEMKKNKPFMIPYKSTLVYETERAYFQLDNLFGGDERLGEQMNEFFNDNWRDVNEELGVKVGDAYAVVFTELILPMFSKYSFDQLLPVE